MKKIVKYMGFLVALGAASGAFAGAPLDGAFACFVSFPGMQPFNAYLAVVTNAQGVSAIAPVSSSPESTRLFGYGFGTASTTSFSGMTNYAQPFSFVVDPQTLAFFGSFGVLVNAAPVTTTLSCQKIF